MGHDHASHAQPAGHAVSVLVRAAGLTLAFAALEALAGWWTGSLALLSDAGHMLTDGAALGLGAFAGWMARRPPSRRHTYGMGRVEVFAAVLNAGAMLVIVAWIAHEALQRLGEPREIRGGAAAAVALVGLLLNLLILRWLVPHGHDLNARGATLHVLGDTLGSVGALASGLVILWTGWTPIDALVSLLICGLLTISSARLLREGLHALMEGVPAGLSLEAVGIELARHPAVTSVHDLHIWTLSGSRVALSAHVVVPDLGAWPRTLSELQQLLHERFAIDHVTLQPEPPPAPLLLPSLGELGPRGGPG